MSATSDTCGLAFDRPLNLGMVDDSVQEDADSGPAASVSNIPLERKRSRP